MTWTRGDIFQLIRAVASIATVVLVFVTWLQLKLLRKQTTTAFEDSLTGQYRKLMEDIPIEIWLGSELKELAPDPEQQNRCRDAIYRYIDLSQEEAFLHRKGRITDEAWIDWRKGIRTNMDLPAFKEVWAQVSNSGRYQERFEELRAVLA